MSIGQVILMFVLALTAAGFCQRVLDRLHLTDRQALFFIALIFIGGLLPNIPLGGRIRVNAGGALIPFALAVYVWLKAGSMRERLRSFIAVLVTAVAVFLLGRYFPSEPDVMPFDVQYLYGIAAGLIAYIFGRSRRGAFIAGTVGMLSADVAQAVILWSRNVEQTLYLGGAGMLDAVVISGVLAVLIAELTGEAIERSVRGAERTGAK